MCELTPLQTQIGMLATWAAALAGGGYVTHYLWERAEARWTGLHRLRPRRLAQAGGLVVGIAAGLTLWAGLLSTYRALLCA